MGLKFHICLRSGSTGLTLRVRLALKPRFLSKGLASQSVRICVFVAQRVHIVEQGSALLARGWVSARLISRWHLSGLVAVASNACEVTLWIDFHGRGLNET